MPTNVYCTLCTIQYCYVAQTGSHLGPHRGRSTHTSPTCCSTGHTHWVTNSRNKPLIVNIQLLWVMWKRKWNIFAGNHKISLITGFVRGAWCSQWILYTSGPVPNRFGCTPGRAGRPLYTSTYTYSSPGTGRRSSRSYFLE